MRLSRIAVFSDLTGVRVILRVRYRRLRMRQAWKGLNSKAKLITLQCFISPGQFNRFAIEKSRSRIGLALAFLSCRIAASCRAIKGASVPEHYRGPSLHTSHTFPKSFRGNDFRDAFIGPNMPLGAIGDDVIGWRLASAGFGLVNFALGPWPLALGGECPISTAPIGNWSMMETLKIDVLSLILQTLELLVPAANPYNPCTPTPPPHDASM